MKKPMYIVLAVALLIGTPTHPQVDDQSFENIEMNFENPQEGMGRYEEFQNPAETEERFEFEQPGEGLFMEESVEPDKLKNKKEQAEEKIAEDQKRAEMELQDRLFQEEQQMLAEPLPEIPELPTREELEKEIACANIEALEE